MDMNDAQTELRELYRELDRQVQELCRMHSDRLACRNGCTDCCVDELTVFQVEAETIRRNCSDVLRRQQPHPPGMCAFLDSNGSCRIYAFRPYVCRTQGLPLRWIEGPEEDEGEEDGEVVEMRDICPLNDAGPPIEELPEEACWTLGPFEERLAVLQAALDGWQLKRILLRELFESQSS